MSDNDLPYPTYDMENAPKIVYPEDDQTDCFSYSLAREQIDFLKNDVEGGAMMFAFEILFSEYEKNEDKQKFVELLVLIYNANKQFDALLARFSKGSSFEKP